jgi:L,D-transpeptidase ErfK/SrfK
MKRTIQLTSLLILLGVAQWACVTQPSVNSNTQVGQTTPSPSPAASPVTAQTDNAVMTLPVLDAFFASDSNFATELKAQLKLTDDQVEQLRKVAREETSKLRENETEDHSGTTTAAHELAMNRINQIVGDEKGSQLASFVSERWRRGTSDSADNGTNDASGSPTGKDSTSTASSAENSLPSTPNSVPSDSRVVVNIPAYRMDVFQNGQLLKSYKVGIGYPEFPLPTGLRQAKAIIFNPPWTPPDEPWVESPASKVKVGQKIEAGSKLNPLGILKIPIGSPSLIHGGKSPAKLGTFASHGCVGLTDPLAQDFAKVIAQLSGTKLSDAAIAGFKRNRSETKQVPLGQPVPVELRYETIVAEDGKLHIYRDVYDHDTNNEDNLRAVLQANGITLEDLTDDERAQVMQALVEMSRDARGKLDAPSPSGSASPSPTVSPKNKSGRVTRTIKGKKEIVIEIAALKGKGYPQITQIR